MDEIEDILANLAIGPDECLARLDPSESAAYQDLMDRRDQVIKLSARWNDEANHFFSGLRLKYELSGKNFHIQDGAIMEGADPKGVQF